MKLARWGLLALVAMALPAFAEGGNVEAGRVKANTCMGCHGIPNYNNVYPTYRVPRIGGQTEAYIVATLKGYKNGDRPQDLYASIFGGLDGSRMPAYLSQISTDSDRWALVAYILSLSPASRPVLHLEDFAAQRATRIGAHGRVLPIRHAP
mgnify:CR=1 FL=1